MRRGPVYMILAGLMFSVMVAAVKVARRELDALEVVCWRSVISLPLAWLFARPVGLRLTGRRVFVLRAVLGFCAMTGFYTAAHGLSVADLSLLTKLQPILVAIMAPIALGSAERAGWLVWVLVAVGLVGCGILLAPDLEVGNTYGLWALAAAAFSAGAHVTVRKLGATDDPRVVVFWFQVALVILAPLTLVATTGRFLIVPSADLWPYLAVCGVTATFGQVLMTAAYKHERAAVVAAASYSGPLWAVLVDLAAFGVLPGSHAIAGGAILLAAGLVLVLRIPAPTTPP